VILGITLSISPYSQNEALKGIYVWGLPLVALIELLRVLLGCVSLAFAIFLIAYAFDSLDFRIMSVLVLALTILIPFGSVLVLAALFRIFGGVIDLSTDSSIVALSTFRKPSL
jgi:hypothetical protein